jgi:hypothetical protein
MGSEMIHFLRRIGFIKNNKKLESRSRVAFKIEFLEKKNGQDRLK